MDIDPAEPELAEHLDDEAPGVPRTGPLRFARMTGSTIAGRDAAAWVTDFLNAAYYRRPAPERDLDDLRLAFAVLTTYWNAKPHGRRLRATDLPAFHRAFGRHRFATAESARGTLSRAELERGAQALLGDWFLEAHGDDARRAWGIAFPTIADRAAHDPGRRLALAPLGPLTPESVPAGEQVWHTYPAVELPSLDGALAILTAPERWPDLTTEIGRFTPLRRGGLLGQTFEIEVAAGTDAGLPIFTRGYVTITDLVTPEDPQARDGWFAALEEGLARYGDDEPPAVPEGGAPVAGFDLTTHQGHFMGKGHNRLLLYTHEDRVWVRAAGTWDPMPWHIERAYRVAGREAQHAFWGQGDVARLSLLHQLAEQAA